MIKIVFATSNRNKVLEVRKILPSEIEIQTMYEAGFNEDVEETERTIEGNSLLKAKTVYDALKIPIIAEDTGLIVHSLNGAPGVYSARYAGTGNSADNINLLLKNLKNKEDRSAHFKTVLTYIDHSGTHHQFEGIVLGKILEEQTGDDGFGYDPVFMPAGFDKTFAEMTKQEKSIISHRGIAFRNWINFLKQ